MGRSFIKKNGRQIDEKNCRVDSTTMYVSSTKIAYTDLYIYNKARMGRSFIEKNGRQIDEKKCKEDSPIMYASSMTTTYTLGGRVR
ncbi:hypothetical protein KIN20_004339 [Parelaphostrongylus tenuis]|uniref:Uncharacterized protein n=1 Tax=Parelaphostrongylus tenuis TaxID=148309 RepID=A0AAD5LYM8_PARTN|nr:hypothetical protein KIN20_004339 [Parelaphostrongylus tenuis]